MSAVHRDENASGRVYRDWFWRGFLLVVSLILLSGMAAAVVTTVRRPNPERVVAVLFLLAALGALQAFAVLSWRIRTVVDDDGVTQYWVTRSYRIPWSEVTGMELAQGMGRWYVQVSRGEQTFEVMPCNRPPSWPFGNPPGVLFDAYQDMRARWAAPETATSPG